MLQFSPKESYNWGMKTTKLILIGWIALLIVSCTTTPVSKKQAFIITSPDQENKMGVQAFQEILQKETPSTNEQLIRIVERVGKRVLAASNKLVKDPTFKNMPWEFRVIESKQLNAFALPGGKVAVYTGILPVCANEAGLAAVMGHEIAHVIARHGGQRMTQQSLVQAGLAAAAISLSGSPYHNSIMGALGVGANVGVILPFGRGNESEADEIGMAFMAEAGYDPREAARFWKRMQSMKQGQAPPEILSTHPSDQTRISDIQKLLPKSMEVYNRNPNKYGLGESLLLAINKERLNNTSAPSSTQTPTKRSQPNPEMRRALTPK